MKENEGGLKARRLKQIAREVVRAWTRMDVKGLKR